MNDPTQLSIYQLRAVLNGVSPLVWRRFLISIETSLADLHNILQLSFGWSGFYLYEFCIHGKTFGSNAEDPRCVGGRRPAPDEDDGGAWDYQRLQDHYKFPPLEALSVLAETTQSVFRNGSRAGIDSGQRQGFW